jgi:hypothetical protein
MIRVQCPRCQKTLGLDEARAADVIMCPACRKPFRLAPPEPSLPSPITPPPIRAAAAVARPATHTSPNEPCFVTLPAEKVENLPSVRLIREPPPLLATYDPPSDLSKIPAAPSLKPTKRAKDRAAAADDEQDEGQEAISTWAVLFIPPLLWLFFTALTIVKPKLFWFTVGVGVVVTIFGGVWYYVCAYEDRHYRARKKQRRWKPLLVEQAGILIAFTGLVIGFVTGGFQGGADNDPFDRDREMQGIGVNDIELEPE